MRLLKVLVFSAVCFSCVILTGCAISTPGETADEVNIRRKRVISTGIKEMQEDIDVIMMLDQPSKLSNRTIR